MIRRLMMVRVEADGCPQCTIFVFNGRVREKKSSVALEGEEDKGGYDARKYFYRQCDFLGESGDNAVELASGFHSRKVVPFYMELK